MAAADLDPCARLCLCGIRGCDLADLHRNAFIEPQPAWQAARWVAKRSRRKRRR